MKWISKKLSNIYRFFGDILICCLAVSFIAMVIFPILNAEFTPPCQGLVLPQIPYSGSYTPPTPTPWYQNIHFGELFGEIITVVLVVGFLASLIYLIAGFVRHFFVPSKKKNRTSAKTLILRGIIGIAIIFLLFFAFSIELGFFGLCL
jgi:hypothetical protein